MVKVAVYHNIIWPRYKGEVFSALHAQAQTRGLAVRFVQIAETDGERAALAPVDLRYHRYPYELLFEGGYDGVPTWRLMLRLAIHVLRIPARLVVLPGYHRPEYWTMLLACMLTGKRRAVFCDSTAFEQSAGRGAKALLKTWLKRMFFRQCDGYFGYGQRSGEYLRGLGARADRIFQPCHAAALPIGFDEARARAERVAARAADPSPRLLYVGRLAPEKDLPLLLRALAQLRAAHADASLVLVGAGPDRTVLEQQVAALGLQDAVEFRGALDLSQLTAEFARALCLVLPSRREPWGLVVNEALHHGCPVVVSSACGCTPELVVEKVSGLSHEPGQLDSLSAALAAATTLFSDVEAVAARCQALMRAYTPVRAAQRMLQGCETMLAPAV